MPRVPAVTLMDVARAARVSRTTASAALSGNGRTSERTRTHVRAVAEQLGYVANPAARHLQGGRRGAIGLYVPDQLTGYAFYMHFAFGAAEVAREHGFALTLLSPTPDLSTAHLLAHVDAVLLVDPVRGDPFVEQLIASPLPVLSAERRLDGPQASITVETEHATAVRALLDHLWEQGARRVALLNLEVEFAWTRLVGDVYGAWCAERAIEGRALAIPQDSDPGSVARLTRELLAAAEPPDAIVSAPDGTALGVVGAAREAGVAVGRELLVASCVDSLPMQLATPPITAIDLQPREIGRYDAAVLLRSLAGEAVPAEVRRPVPSLLRRASTGVAVPA